MAFLLGKSPEGIMVDMSSSHRRVMDASLMYNLSIYIYTYKHDLKSKATEHSKMMQIQTQHFSY